MISDAKKAKKDLYAFDKQLSKISNEQMAIGLIKAPEYETRQLIAQTVYYMKLIYGEMDITKLPPNIDRLFRLAMYKDIAESEMSTKQ